ncbi:uncharacterized protein B0I36DRAFT_374043 [Microdochium trichocladiopsis]|uniref:Vacuolar protein sorting-associated protein 17 n=1 Tax=Microdochium trichocladiopsis TaxID=1682393 RepID=A0A9P9BN55_9PEZI|nr:uncharacterized protein B0I36DRAFT_374043 [Microdochium trichocladiopsis]KAH7030916.1 hypothetical protein B0I36DRAFT_374043 [Microdochium trichocladiopsis]
MDYRSSIPDDDHPGASPWGSSPPASPRRNLERQAPSFRYDAQAAGEGFGQEDHDANVFNPSQSSTASQATTDTSFAPSAESSQQEQTDVSDNTDHHQSQASVQDPDHPDAQQHQQNFSQNPAGDNVAHDQPQQPRRSNQPQYKLQAKITGLERTGRKDPILRFDVHTNLPTFRTTQFRDVRRMHSEFVKLGEHLISANPEVFVPAVPPSITSAGAGTDEDETRVKALLQRWFNHVCSNEVLMRDDEMVLFVESDFGYSPMVKRKQPATGVRRKLLKQFAPPPDDTPELSQARPVVKLFYLGSMDAGHKVDKLVKSRRGLGLAESDFGVKLGGMNVQEPHQGLANAFRKLGKVIQTVGDYHAAQATAEATTMGDPFQYHSQDAFIVKETLTNRQLLIREFLQAQENTRSKLNSADRLKASSSVRREKVDEAITALDDARNAEMDLMHKTTRVTQNLVHERRKWFNRTAADLRMSIREYVVREIDAERRTLSVLESVRPDIRAIDSSGGLSRLGREAHPQVRRTSQVQSQGPKGDAWSAAPRRSDALNRSTLLPNAEDPEAEDSAQATPGSGPAAAGGAAGGRGGLMGLPEEEDDDRVDARNAASRLATSTF